MLPPYRPCPVVTRDLSLPVAAQLSDLPAEVVAGGARLMQSMVGDWDATLAKQIVPAIDERTEGRFRAEAEAFGRQIGAPWENVLLANVSYDLIMASFACSSLALATDDGPVLARNMDWWPERPLAQTSLLWRFAEGGRPAMWIGGWPGSIGVVTGMSSRGFALALNSVPNPDRPNLDGYPALLHLRRVLEDAADFDEAVDAIDREPLAASALVMVVGLTNEQRVVVERTGERSSLRWPEGDEPLRLTNDYRHLFPPSDSDVNPLYQSSCERFERLGELTAHGAVGSDPDDAALLGLLTDPGVKQPVTVQHAIMRPSREQFGLWSPSELLDA